MAGTIHSGIFVLDSCKQNTQNHPVEAFGAEVACAPMIGIDLPNATRQQLSSYLPTEEDVPLLQSDKQVYLETWDLVCFFVGKCRY